MSCTGFQSRQGRCTRPQRSTGPGTGPSIERAQGASAASLDGSGGLPEPFEAKGRDVSPPALCLPARGQGASCRFLVAGRPGRSRAVDFRVRETFQGQQLAVRHCQFRRYVPMRGLLLRWWSTGHRAQGTLRFCPCPRRPADPLYRTHTLIALERITSQDRSALKSCRRKGAARRVHRINSTHPQTLGPDHREAKGKRIKCVRGNYMQPI
jgi:hypothetical protein